MVSTSKSGSAMAEKSSYHLPCKKVHGSWSKKGDKFALKATCPYCGTKINKRDLKAHLTSGNSFTGYVYCDCGRKVFLTIPQA